MAQSVEHLHGEDERGAGRAQTQIRLNDPRARDTVAAMEDTCRVTRVFVLLIVCLTLVAVRGAEADAAKQYRVALVVGASGSSTT